LRATSAPSRPTCTGTSAPMRPSPRGATISPNGRKSAPTGRTTISAARSPSPRSAARLAKRYSICAETN
ncbi:uncharacterized protein METZ01_LOCUS116704, partial [marine metagenome]